VAQPSGRVARALPTLPLAQRNRLSELIIRSLSDPDARRALIALAARCQTAPPEDWLANARSAEVDTFRERVAVDAFCERVRRGAQAVAAGPLIGVASDAQAALHGAAVLFDAGLYFEVHEVLEPHWIAALGSDREALQGLIQIAVGYQHLANENLKGARALLDEGSAKIQARRLYGADLDPFARGVRATLVRVTEAMSFDWTQVPRWPREED
jgi:Domain of unknown function (DUF309)